MYAQDHFLVHGGVGFSSILKFLYSTSSEFPKSTYVTLNIDSFILLNEALYHLLSYEYFANNLAPLKSSTFILGALI